MPQKRLYLTVPEISSRLEVTPMTIYKLIATGKLKAKKVVKHWRINPSDLEEFIKVWNIDHADSPRRVKSVTVIKVKQISAKYYDTIKSKPVLSFSEGCDYINISPSTLHRYMEDGIIDYIAINRPGHSEKNRNKIIRFRRCDIDKFLSENKKSNQSDNNIKKGV